MAAEGLIIAVVGPTASGKTDLGLELAKHLNGEIISADSRQIYRRLNAGTAKPEGKWTKSADGRDEFIVRGVPYHLVDIADPTEKTDAGKYALLAKETMNRVRARGKTPIFVGGTGLYLRAALEGLDPLPPRSAEIREELAELAENNGPEWLHEELSRVDPEAAKKINANNLHRVVRALEVYRQTGRPISSLWSGPGARTGLTTLYLGIQWDRTGLEARIQGRSRAIFPKMIEETTRLVPSTYTGKEPGFESLGYPEALQCLRGEIPEETGLNLMTRATLQYAKRQATWFRKQTAVRWIPSGDGEVPEWTRQALSLIEEFAASARHST